jgi:hypothetical protein
MGPTQRAFSAFWLCFDGMWGNTVFIPYFAQTFAETVLTFVFDRVIIAIIKNFFIGGANEKRI